MYVTNPADEDQDSHTALSHTSASTHLSTSISLPPSTRFFQKYKIPVITKRAFILSECLSERHFGDPTNDFGDPTASDEDPNKMIRSLLVFPDSQVKWYRMH